MENKYIVVSLDSDGTAHSYGIFDTKEEARECFKNEVDSIPLEDCAEWSLRGDDYFKFGVGKYIFVLQIIEEDEE